MSIISKARIAHELSSVSIAVAEYLLDNYSIVRKFKNISRNIILQYNINLFRNQFQLQQAISITAFIKHDRIANAK